MHSLKYEANAYLMSKECCNYNFQPILSDLSYIYSSFCDYYFRTFTVPKYLTIPYLNCFRFTVGRLTMDEAAASSKTS